jgi:hypothetical protein
MTDSLEVKGIDLRYLLTAYLFDYGPATIDELVDALAYHGFRPAGRPSKSVSEALRWEIFQGRAVRMRRGRYRPGKMPRATADRIYKRVRALHDDVAALSPRSRRLKSPPIPPAA